MYQTLVHDSLTLTVKTARNEGSIADPDLVEIYNISDVDEISFVKCSCCNDRFVVVAGVGGEEVTPKTSRLSEKFLKEQGISAAQLRLV